MITPFSGVAGRSTPVVVWRVSVRDLLFRRRRFLIATAVTALVFGLTLVLDGLVESIGHESNRIVGLFDADHWLVADGGSGPFTTTRLLTGPMSRRSPTPRWAG
jgi:hypothetical protein